ncbi:MAG: sensor histidine kinase [Chloroflexota bacterium]
MKRPDYTIRAIRRRLFILLVRAFATVVLLLAFLMLAVTAYFLSYPTRFNPLERLPIVARLETFYRITGSWDGAEGMFTLSSEDEDVRKSRPILLDAQGRIVLYEGRPDAPQVGQAYSAAPGDASIPLTIDDQMVGMLILRTSMIPVHGQLAMGILAPLSFISVFLALLTVVIGLLLMRRVVTPLAEVIAAARKVASGDLSTRVPASGPQDLRLLSDNFNQMAAALQESDQQRRDLLADVAHELRTPLTVMRGRLEGIVDGVYPPEAAQIVPALEETYLLERLVEDLRLLTLAETRQLPFEARDLPLGDLAARAVDLFAAQAEELGIRLEIENRAPQALVRVDPQRTEQVIGNLVANALRYAPRGGKIWLEVEQDGGSVLMRVNDNGPGVPPEHLPHLFQRFWRGEKSRSRASGGAGLGLAIARQLVEAQGGSIRAENLREGGLRVEMIFPAAREGE